MNTLITPTWVTKSVATNFKMNLKLIGLFDRQYNDSFANAPEGEKIGYTVQARIQQRWPVTEGQALVQQAITNQTVPITINHQFQIGMGWSSAQDRLEIEEVNDRYTKPAGMAQAAKWDSVAGLEVYKQVYFAAGTPGVAVTSNQTYTDAVADLMNYAVPEPYYAVLDPQSVSAFLNANFALLNPANRIGDLWRKGQIAGEALGIDEWYGDPLIPIHTTGSFTASTPVVSGASQTGTSLAISGMGTYAFKAGDTFTIDGVYAVNPVSYTDTGILQSFSIQANVSGSSTATLTISPSIITSGQLQTVTASPANGAAITFRGATGTVGATMTATRSRQSLIFNEGAFAFVMVDLPSNLPGANAKRVNSKASGISMRWVEQYNIQTDQSPSRCDTIGGVAAVLPYFAKRIYS